MTKEEMQTALYEKFRAEQDNYRAWLLKQPPEEILRHSYEYTVREDIVMMMEDAELSPQQAAALLWKGTTLGDIYRDFTKLETGDMDMLRDTVENRADDILREAANVPHIDFEDDIQLASALRCGADYLISRNTGDYPAGLIPVLTPTDYLAFARAGRNAD